LIFSDWFLFTPRPTRLTPLSISVTDEPSRFPDARENENDVYLDTYFNST
jgi:hypothetical protein